MPYSHYSEQSIGFALPELCYVFARDGSQLPALPVLVPVSIFIIHLSSPFPTSSSCRLPYSFASLGFCLLAIFLLLEFLEFSLVFKSPIPTAPVFTKASSMPFIPSPSIMGPTICYSNYTMAVALILLH